MNQSNIAPQDLLLQLSHCNVRRLQISACKDNSGALKVKIIDVAVFILFLPF